MNIKSQITAIVEWMSDEDLEQYKGRPSRTKGNKPQGTPVRKPEPKEIPDWAKNVLAHSANRRRGDKKPYKKRHKKG